MEYYFFTFVLNNTASLEPYVTVSFFTKKGCIEIMKLELTEIAKCLDLPINTIERWVRQGRMPIRKSGSVCIFKKIVLEKWAKKHNIGFTLPPRNKLETETETETAESIPLETDETLTAAMKRGGVHHISGDTVEDILKKASTMVPCLDQNEQKILFDKLLEREKLTSTGIGKGVAIPHPRTPISDKTRPPVIATFFLKDPVDFGAIDDKPVTVMFVIICPSVQSHLHLLSMVSFCVREDSFISFLNTLPKSDDFYSTISTTEKELEKRR